MSRVGKLLLFFVLITQLSAVSYADNHSENIYINGNEEVMILSDNISGDQFSSEIVKGDYNGDNIQDLAISSPYASSFMKEWNGKVSIYFGGGDNLSEADLVLYGKNSGDLSGMAMSSADLNEDGIDDLIIGSHNALTHNERTGKVSIFFGSSSYSDQYFVLENSEFITEIIGNKKDSNFGLSMYVADVDGDTKKELLIGAPTEKIEENDIEGLVYIYSYNNGEIGEKVRKIYSPDKGIKFASEISVLDLDFDGLNEILISAYRQDIDDKSEAGAIYVYKNNDLYPEVFEKMEFKFRGNENYQWFGFQTEVFDMNKDNISDLLVSSFPFADKERTGEVFVFFGEKDFFSNTEKEANQVFSYDISNNILGASLIATDINLDGKADIIAGAPGIGYPKSEDSGVVHVFDLEGRKNTIYGENADDWFGYTLESLDFNMDGFGDLVVGAKYADSRDNVNTGKAYIIFGSEDGFKTEMHSSEKSSEEKVSRAEIVYKVVNAFDLKEKNASFVSNCLDYREFCFFEFMARSNFSDIKLEPEIILYPDNLPGMKYYEEINLATILGVVNGFIEEENSPFLPEKEVSRIHALKIILGSSDLMEFKYKFELENSLGSLEEILNQSSYFRDVSAKISHMWWYPRYLNFAYEVGIVDKTEDFRPDDPITFSELNDMIEKTKEYLTLKNASTQTES